MQIKRQSITQTILRFVRWLHRLDLSADPLEKVWWTTCSLAFIGMGVSLSWWASDNFTLSRSSKTWSAVSCTIITSTAEEHYREQGIGRMANVHRIYYAVPLVKCEYIIDSLGLSINERTFQYTMPITQEFRGLTRADNKNRAVQWSAKHYPKGMRLTVYFNPEDPFQAVLTPGNMSSIKFLWCVGIGIGLFMLGTIMFLSVYLPARLSKK